MYMYAQLVCVYSQLVCVYSPVFTVILLIVCQLVVYVHVHGAAGCVLTTVNRTLCSQFYISYSATDITRVVVVQNITYQLVVYVYAQGLVFTMILLVVYQRPLPALPISTAFGLMSYFLMNYISNPFLTQLHYRQIFV